MLTKKSTKNTQIFSCKNCDFECSKPSYWSRHIGTAKHLRLTSVNTLVSRIEDEKKSYDCTICNKPYKSRVGLWKHTKHCKPVPEETVIATPESVADLELKTISLLVVDLIKSNQDLQKQMLEVCKTSITTTNNTTNHNSHNKTFNLQFFLNEQCKDAMNIMEFVDTFQLQFSDLERIGEVGYVEGISNIVMDKLSQMDIYKRPIHCSDAKREIMHVKDKDVWEKENAANDKIRLALKHITKKNTDLLRPWVNAHPGVLDSDHRLNDKYQLLFIEAMGGNKNKTMREGEDKIIKKISKMVLIDKGVA
jgi:hypothetical protein